MNIELKQTIEGALVFTRDSLKEHAAGHIVGGEAVVGAEIARLDAALEWLKQQTAAPQPDWSQAPEWAQWWAVDCDGRACWYRVEPGRGRSGYTASGWNHTDYEEVDRVVLPLGIDWRTLKEKRP